MSPNDFDSDRVTHHLRLFGAEYDPPPGWEARVLAASVPPRRETLLGIIGALAVGMLAGLLVIAAIAWLAGWL